MANSNLYALFETRFKEAADQTALRQPGGRTLTYDDLLQEVGRYANALSHLGVQPGDRVSVQIEKSLENVFLYLATLKIGAAYHPLNPAYSLREVDFFISDARPAVVITDDGRREGLAALADRYDVRHMGVMNRDGSGDFIDLAAGMSPNAATEQRDANDLAGLFYTSGTTGRSKGAMISHGNLAANAVTLHKLWGFVHGDILLHALPIFHVHGLHIALHTAFLNTSEIIWMPKFNTGDVIEHLPSASVMMGVPTFYTRLLADAGFNRDKAAHMRLFISGSAPLLAETHTLFEERTGHRILERYGMTETGMMTSNPLEGERLAGTVGYALPDVDLRIASAEGQELARGDIGVIEAKGPNIFQGYWNLPEKTEEEIRADGFFITGDLASMTEDGRVTISGRTKDLIISGGFNIYPKEIEDLIDDLPGVGESAVIGVPHPDFGEGVVAVLTGEGGLTEQGILGALADQLAKFKMPKRVHFVAELPRNVMSKVQKAELRTRFAEEFMPAGKIS